MPSSRDLSASAPPERSAWQALVGASAQALLNASPGRSSPERLDARLARAICDNGSAHFDAALASLQSASPKSKGPLPAPLALKAAASHPNAYYLSRLLLAGANPNERPAWTPGDPAFFNNDTLLHHAARSGSPAAIAALARAGADTSLADDRGATALALACELGLPDCAQALRHAGSPVNQPDLLGHTPLSRSLPYSFDEEPLWAASFHALDETALLERLARGSRIASMLLRDGARADSPGPASPKQLPPLAAAIRLGDEPLAQALIDAGADASWLTPPPKAPAPSHIPAWLLSPEDPARAESPCQTFARILSNTPRFESLISRLRSYAQARAPARAPDPAPPEPPSSPSHPDSPSPLARRILASRAPPPASCPPAALPKPGSP